MKKALLFMTIVVAFALSSCGAKGDPEIENKIAGTWTAEGDITEDGIDMHASVSTHYDADSHKFSAEGKCTQSYMGYRIGSFTMYAEGKWSATKDEIIEEYDMDKVRVEFSYDYLENCGMSEAEARKGFMEELKPEMSKPQRAKLRLISDNEMEQTESDGLTWTYYRQ